MYRQTFMIGHWISVIDFITDIIRGKLIEVDVSKYAYLKRSVGQLLETVA